MGLNFHRQLNGLQLIPQNTIVPNVLGELRYNSSSNELELYNGSLDIIVTQNGTTPLSNKTLISATVGNSSSNSLSNTLTFEEITSTPSSNPPSGEISIYAKADGAFYTLNSSGIENGLGLSTIFDARILSNISGSPAIPIGNTLTSIIDHDIAAVQGDILYRNSSAWVALPPGTSGQILSTGGAGANPAWVSAGGTGSVTSVGTGTGLTGGPITTSGTISLANTANNTVLANISGISAAPAANSLSSVIDSSISSAQGSILYRDSSSWLALAPGTNGQLLKTQGASANPIWSSSGSSLLSVVTKTGNYTATLSDDVILCNSASFAVSLPTVAGNAGKVYYIEKTDANLNNFIILNPVGGETIGTFTAVRATTQGECWQLVADPTNSRWEVLNHFIPNTISSAVATTISATTTPPTKGGTIIIDQVTWKRIGRYATFEFKYAQSTGGTAGSGDYTLVLPSPMTIDTGTVTAYTGATIFSITAAAVPSLVPCSGVIQLNDGLHFINALQASVFSGTQIRIGGLFDVSGAVTWNPGSVTFNATDMSFYINVTVPINQWFA